ncbi:MAG TPA: AAA family ATPase [Armatimonadota bacterium]
MPAGTLTFLLTDVEGSTRLWERHPEAMRSACARHDALVESVVDAHDGVLVRPRGEGDSRFAVFPLATNAVTAASVLQTALHAETWPREAALRVRIALHTGEADLREGDYYGAAVNRCARLREIAHGGQTLLSQATAGLVQDSLPRHTRLLDLGDHLLRDLERSERVYQLTPAGLPEAYPSLRSMERFAHNLPVQLTSFVGREEEVSRVRDLLGQTRLLTLVGVGGTGKTRLALQAAAGLLEAFPDGVWLVDLAPTGDADRVPQTVAAALGVREQGGQPLVATLSEHLKSRSVLLLLDNCEHLLDACARLTESLLRASPGLRVLTTSREGLGVTGETLYRVSSLRLPDAGEVPSLDALTGFPGVQLFLERARAAAPGFAVTAATLPSVLDVCRHLDGIPLAIELAAARVGTLPLERIARGMSDRFRLLTGGSRTAPPRLQTLRATMDWSYDLLTEPEQTLLRRLSVFVGGWTLEAAEEVGSGQGVGEWEVIDRLGALVEKSLVVYDEGDVGGRYHMLETVRQYARDRLLDTGEAEDLRQRHLTFYLGLAEEAERHLYGPEQAAHLRSLERDHDNLRAALEESLVRGEDEETALRMVGALGQFWLQGSYLREARDWVDRALARGGEASPLARARALVSGSACVRHCGDHELAARLAEEGLQSARMAQDRPTIARALFEVSLIATWRGELDEAWASAGEGLALAQAEGNRWLESRHLAVLGRAAALRGRHDTARTHFEEALGASRELGDEWHIGMTLANLGFVTRRAGSWEEAGALHREGVVLHQRLGDRRGVCWHLVGLAGVEVSRGREARAVSLLGAAAAAMRANGLVLPPDLREEQANLLAQTRELLGEEPFAAAWAQGEAMPLGEAVASALESPEHVA